MNLRMLVLGLAIVPVQMMGQVKPTEGTGYAKSPAKPKAVIHAKAISPDPLPKACGPKNDEQCVAGHDYSLADIKIESVTLTVNQGDDSSQITWGVQRVVSLSSNEYARLQKLRQAVVDAETEIAKAHNVRLRNRYDCLQDQRMGNACSYDGLPDDKDTYEFRGQFLLINVPPATK